jgi:hypothetical protein
LSLSSSENSKKIFTKWITSVLKILIDKQNCYKKKISSQEVD